MEFITLEKRSEDLTTVTWHKSRYANFTSKENLARLRKKREKERADRYFVKRGHQGPTPYHDKTIFRQNSQHGTG